MSERPRRSVRVPAKYQEHPVEEETASDAVLPFPSKKRKAATAKSSYDDPDSVNFLFQNPRSPLVSLELSTLINEHTWAALSEGSRALLCTLLPTSAFPFSRSTLHPLHPANRLKPTDDHDAGPIDVDSTILATEPSLSFLSDAFFEAAAKTFQDHLYSGWLTPAHDALVQEYQEKTITGKNHAPWKDDTWNAEHPAPNWYPSASDGLAGDASSLTLQDLAKHSVLRVGDVLAYRRSFSQLNITVMKDALIRYIHPTTRSLTVLVAPSKQRYLPLEHLRHPDMSDNESQPANGSQVQEMTISNPSQLETALLDIDGRLEKAKRPNGNAWKCLGVWRWREDVVSVSAYAEDSEEAARGGRECRGTLFYLRGCFYDDQ